MEQDSGLQKLKEFTDEFKSAIDPKDVERIFQLMSENEEKTKEIDALIANIDKDGNGETESGSAEAVIKYWLKEDVLRPFIEKSFEEMTNMPFTEFMQKCLDILA